MLQFPTSVEYIRPMGSQQLFVRCKDHNYWGQVQGPMISGCKACWICYYFVRIAKGEFADGSDEQLELLLNHVAEDLQDGEFDLKLFKKPQVEQENQIKIVEG